MKYLKGKKAKDWLLKAINRSLAKAQKYPEFVPLIPDIERIKTEFLTKNTLSFKDGISIAMYIRCLD